MYIGFPGGLRVLFILSPLEYARLQQGHRLPADKLSPGWITLQTVIHEDNCLNKQVGVA